MGEHAAQPPQSTTSLDQFEILVGEWTMEGIHPALPAAAHGHSTFEWLKDKSLMAWRFEWESSGIPSALSVIGHDNAAETCSMLYADERGVARIYHMSLDGSVWKMWRDSPGFSQRMTGMFSADGNTIVVHGELSHDGSSWEQDLDVTYSRQQ
jgi:hypothetical protein